MILIYVKNSSYRRNIPRFLFDSTTIHSQMGEDNTAQDKSKRARITSTHRIN